MNQPTTKSRQSFQGLRRALAAAAILVVLLASPGHRSAWGEDLAGTPPMPPLPEDVQEASAITPVSLEVATPLPLETARNPGSSASASGLAPHAPMGNWSVLAAIASAFVVLASFRFWQSRRTSRELPSDVFEILGEAALGNQHAVRVVRFGPRTLLVGISTAGCQTLATLDDPQATERIVSACLGSRMPRATRATVRPQSPAGSSSGGEAR
jgi:hypothetical protein